MSATAPQAPVSRAASLGGTAAVVVAIGGAVTATAIDHTDHYQVPTAVAMALLLGTVAIVGLAVTLTAPTNRVGWLLLAGADALAVGGVHRSRRPRCRRTSRLDPRRLLPGSARAGAPRGRVPARRDRCSGGLPGRSPARQAVDLGRLVRGHRNDGAVSG